MKVNGVTFDNFNGRPVAVYHSFELLTNGDVIHEIDGTARAVIPPEGRGDYAEQYPLLKELLAGSTVVVDNSVSGDTPRLRKRKFPPAA